MTCTWFTLCTNPVQGAIVHPVLGEVPACARCAERAGTLLKTLPGQEVEEDPLSIPCAECGAEVGEECRRWCTGLDWIPDQDDPDYDDSDARRCAAQSAGWYHHLACCRFSRRPA